jgi:hypothetical protein
MRIDDIRILRRKELDRPLPVRPGQTGVAQIFWFDFPDGWQQVNGQILGTHVFHEPVLPSRIALKITRASKPPLIANDQPTLEAIRFAGLRLYPRN